MNRIHFEVNPETNYVYHMLSVMKCGYDNAYGAKYRSLYKAEELAVFHKHSALITVKGGEHCGFLHGVMVGQPALGEMSAKDYYQELVDIGLMIKGGNIPEGVNESLIPYTDVILSLSEIMVRHYDQYMEEIWPWERGRIVEYAAVMEKLFQESRFTEKAEEMVGKLGSPCFTATLVSSVEGGAEGINISWEKDVFGIERSPEAEQHFVAHEYIIYLLFEALKDEDAFRSLETWPFTEGLAEYYLKRILGCSCFGGKMQEHCRIYESIPGAETMPPAALYRRAMYGR
ncbi:MAG: hypothetical protein E7331_07570 [Clostridiales bacterium]|nr:hypothetical protein [Clostridiales bacterium]